MGIEIFRTTTVPRIERPMDTVIALTGDITLACFARWTSGNIGNAPTPERSQAKSGFNLRINATGAFIRFVAGNGTTEEVLTSTNAVPNTEPGQGIVCVFNGSAQEQRIFQGTNSKETVATTITSITSPASRDIIIKSFGNGDIIYLSNIVVVNRAWTDEEAKSFINTGGVLPNWESIKMFLPLNEKQDGGSYSNSDVAYNLANPSADFEVNGIDGGGDYIKGYGGFKTSIRRRG